MKPAVIVLLIAVMCIQCELSFGNQTKKVNRRRIIAKKPQPIKATSNGQYGPGAGHYGTGTGQYWPGAGQYWPAAGQYWPSAGHYGPTAGHYGPGVGHYGPGAGQYGPAAISIGQIMTSDNADDTNTTVIKGENGVITVNGKAVQKNDKQFVKGIVTMNILNGRILINDNVVFEKKPSSPNNSGSSIIASSGIKYFTIKVRENGSVEYSDNKLGGGKINAHL
ncbi:uncharacterized protein LOC135847296 [Planococcus citri]|uniref:uncharacterized protein LOC135847296 n=1 Tax=Planococcus citri TaxID=170843 RepID=UPI0031F85B81